MSLVNSKFFRAVFFVLVLFILFILLARYWVIATDYFFTFRPITESFIHGETQLYDSKSLGYFNLPWSIFIFLPTIFLPFRYGQSLLLVISLLGLLISIAAVQGNNKFNFLVITLALANLHTFDQLIRGNIDGIVGMGIGLAWIGIKRKNSSLLSIGLWLMSIKPINIILTIPVFVRAVWHWSWQDKLLSVWPLAVTVALAFPIFGIDWPIRYIRFINENPPYTFLQTSLWRAFAFFGLQQNLALWLFLMVVVIFSIAMVRVKSVNRMTLAFALSTNLVFSPYTLGSHYVLLASVFVVLAGESKWFLATWFLTLMPLVRLILGFEVAWLDIMYPTALMFGSAYILFRDHRRVNSGLEATGLPPRP